MPYLPSSFGNGVIYLYQSVQDAEAGAQSGGSGFFAAVPSEIFGDRAHIYAVSCAHVINTNPVVRYNKLDGTEGVLDLTPDDWDPHPDGDDIAIHDVEIDLGMAIPALPREVCLSNDDIETYAIGPGDDCLMVGRFVHHDGRQTNRPIVRFGNLAMMEEPVWQGQYRNRDQLSYLVEMRSISGFSGAPVFVYFATLGFRTLSDGSTHEVPTTGIDKSWLLGLNWGHIPATDLDPLTLRPRTLGSEALSSAIAAVVPAWKLAEMLDDPERADLRRRLDERDLQLGKEVGGGILDVAGKAPGFAAADFEEALRRATRITPPAESDPRG